MTELFASLNATNQAPNKIRCIRPTALDRSGNNRCIDRLTFYHLYTVFYHLYTSPCRIQLHFEQFNKHFRAHLDSVQTFDKYSLFSEISIHACHPHWNRYLDVLTLYLDSS